MIGDGANGIHPTRPGTGVAAFVVDTGRVRGALRVGQTLWPATFVGVAVVFGYTFADGVVVL